MSRKTNKSLPDPQDELLATLSNDKAEWQVTTTDEAVLSQVDYSLATGIKSFDDIVGGMPFGRIVEVFGLESSGKTAMAIRCAIRAKQKMIRRVIRNGEGETSDVAFEDVDPENVDVMVLYIDNEGSLDLDGKLTFEGQPIRLTNLRCDTTENMLKAIDKTLDVAEERMEKYPNRKLFTVIVVDTIASTTTEKELNADWGALDFPRQPQQLSRGLARLVRKVNRLNCCLICTNQVRSTFQQGGPGKRASFGISAKDYKASGGHALRFYASHRVFMYAMDSKYKLVPNAKFAAGFQIGFHIVKNRIKAPLRDGRMVLLFDKQKGGFNDQWSMLETMIYLGFVEVRAKEKGVGFILKFKKNGITPTTFGGSDTTTSLDDDDEIDLPVRGGSRKDPEFKYRSDWPEFFEKHKADVEKLWAAAMEYCAATQGLEGSVVIDEEAIDDDE